MSPVIELRQYTLHPGRRDVLIELFDREFVESQEAVGIRVIGQFRDLDAADRFVWLRGFPDMVSRARSLSAFYDGRVWAAHREAANATMVDSDDVLLLRPARTESGFVLPAERPPADAATPPATLVVATIYELAAPADEGFVRFFAERMSPVLIETGARPIAAFQTEPAENTFPRLSVRTGENAFVWFASFESCEQHHRHVARLAQSETWNETVLPELMARLAGPPQQLRLEPTARSILGRAARSAIAGDRHDFDFLAGEWTVANRRLRRRGAGADDWDEFPATHRSWPLLGATVNVDEMIFPTKGFSGLALRAFDAERRHWSIYWVSSARGVLEPPVVGGFAGDRGEFYGEDDDEGRPVAVRFLWDRLGPDAARWEQAFSYGGGPWETNWIMQFTRAGAAAP